MSSDRSTFSVDAFGSYLAEAGDLVLIGGQAVAWWEKRYLKPQSPILSRDIDFWTEREDMEVFLERTRLKARRPHRYELTVLMGVADIRIEDRPSQIEFLHTVPGLDTTSRNACSVRQTLNDAAIQILDPISLALTKLHALRNFDQTDRLDALHLKVGIAAAREFLKECLAADPDLVLWHVERLAKAALQKRNQRVAKENNLDFLDGIPLEDIQAIATDTQNEKLLRFLDLRWPQIKDAGMIE